MKTLKGLLFLGLITIFSSYSFAQGPSPTKFGIETPHQEYRSPDNGPGSSAKKLNNDPNRKPHSDDPYHPRFNLKNDWIDDVTESWFYGLF